MLAKTVLVIDYEPDSVKATSATLERARYRVESVRDGIAGLQAFGKLKPDLVIVEAMLPKKHGFEVCQAIKGSPDGARTAVVITTAIYKGRKYRADAFGTYRCDEYLEKPFTEEQLLTICRRLLHEEGAFTPSAVPAAAPAASGGTVQAARRLTKNSVSRKLMSQRSRSLVIVVSPAGRKYSR